VSLPAWRQRLAQEWLAILTIYQQLRIDFVIAQCRELAGSVCFAKSLFKHFGVPVPDAKTHNRADVAEYRVSDFWPQLLDVLMR
jgi:hypothetical protein